MPWSRLAGGTTAVRPPRIPHAVQDVLIGGAVAQHRARAGGYECPLIGVDGPISAPVIQVGSDTCPIADIRRHLRQSLLIPC